MPVLKKDDKVLLMLMLTEFTEQQKKKLVGFLEADRQVINGGVKVKTWTPSKCLLDTIAVQGPHRDSLANVHALAMLAYQSGLEFQFHTSFVVADELTKRCWEGTHRVGERGVLSLLMVSVRPEIPAETSPSISSPPPLVRVMISRFSDTLDQHENVGVSDVDSNLSSDDFLIYDCFSMEEPRVVRQSSKHGLLPFMLEEFRWEAYNSFLRGVLLPEYHCKIRKLYYLSKPGAQRSYSISYHSIYLLDPDKEIFSTESPHLSTRKQYLKTAWSALSSRLPPELSTEIISRADLVPFFRAPLWRRRQSQGHLHIFVMFPTKEDELREAHLIIHDALQKRSKEQKEVLKTTELIPLHRHGMRSRRDVVAFWNEYRTQEPDERWNDPLLNLMLKPIQNKAVDLSQFAIVSSGGARPVFVLRTTLDTLCIVSTFGSLVHIARDYGGYNADLVEATYNPDQPYYYNPPIWEAVGNLFTDKYLVVYNWISVFYLTKHLTDSEDLVLRKEVHKVDGQDRYDIDPDASVNYDTEQRKDVCFVPWEHDEDGTLDDIWSIVLEIYKHEGFGRRFARFFCLDRQSVEDQTLIIVEPDFFLAGRKVQDEGDLLQGMVAPTLAGFRCNRVPCEDAHDSKMELDLCYRTIEEIGGLDNEGQHFVRPGWPGPGVLPPTNPWRLGWPEPSQPGTIPVWDIFGSHLDVVNDHENEEGGEE